MIDLGLVCFAADGTQGSFKGSTWIEIMRQRDEFYAEHGAPAVGNRYEVFQTITEAAR